MSSKKTSERDVCPECGSKNIIYDEETGEVVCGNCGLVLSDLTFERPRKSHPPTVWDYLSFRNTRDKLKSKERTELTIAMQISLLCSKIHVPSVVKHESVITARKLLKKLRKTRKVRFTCEELAAVSTYITCKKRGIPVTLREISTALGWKKTAIYTLLSRLSKYVTLPSRLIPPVEYLPRIIAKISSFNGDLSPQFLLCIEEYARQILKIAEEDEELKGELERRNPLLVAAAAIYAADEKMGGRIIYKKVPHGRVKRSLLYHVTGFDVSIVPLAERLERLAPRLPPESFKYVYENIRKKKGEVLAETISQ